MPSSATTVKYKYGRASATPIGCWPILVTNGTSEAPFTIPQDQPHSNIRVRLSSSSSFLSDCNGEFLPKAGPDFRERVK